MNKIHSIFSLFRLAYITLLLFVANAQYTYGQDNTPELCKDAIHVCGNMLNGLQGSLPDTNITEIIWPSFGFPNSGICGLAGEFNNTIWYSFVTCDTTVHLRIVYSNCIQPDGIVADAGIQLGLYSKCKHTSSVACTESQGAQAGVLELKYNNFIPGELAFLVLDGYSSSVCDFRIEVIKGIDTTPPTKPDTTLLNDGAITGPNVITCQTKGQPIRYNLTKPGCKINLPPSCVSTVSTSPNGVDSIQYIWTVTPASGRTMYNIDSLGATKDIVFTDLGTYTIEARAVFHPAYGGACENGGCGKIEKWVVEVKDADTIKVPLIVICPQNTYDYCGQIITKDTTIYCQLNACDVEEQTFKIEQYIDTDLGFQTVCKGDNYMFQGQQYSPGMYTIIDNLDCKKRFSFEVEEIQINVSINTIETELTCATKEIILNGIANSNGSNPISYNWYNAANALVGTNNSLSITAQGSYRLDVAYNITSTNVCRESTTIFITQDTDVPKISAFIPLLTCKNPTQPLKRLTITSNINLVSSEWKTPNGSIFSGTIVVVDSASVLSGDPFLFHGVAANGCTVDTAFVVPYNFKKPNITVDGNILTCLNPLTNLTMSSDMQWDSIRWSFTDGTSIDYIGQDNSTVTAAQNKKGTYIALVKAQESQCFSTGSKFINEDKLLPQLDLGFDQKWNCNTTNIDLKPLSVDKGPSYIYNWTTSNNGSISGSTVDDNTSISAPGSYSLSVFNSLNGCQKKDTINIERETNIPTNIELIAQDITCFSLRDGNITIGNVSGGIPPLQYSIDNIAVNNSNLLNLGAGTYTIMVKDKFDCAHSKVVNITEPKELTITTTQSFNLEYEENKSLDFSSSYDLNELAFISWIDKSGNILGNDPSLQYTAIQNDDLLITIKNENGCTTSTRVKIYVDSDLKIFLPNVFSPNGDGANDRFTIFKNKIPIASNKMSVFDRYGNILYNEAIDFNDINSGWDGKFNSRYVEQGVYIIIFEYQDIAGISHVIKGSVLVSR